MERERAEPTGAGGSQRTNVARERTSFVGRAVELAHIERVVGEGASLVTLVAPPGMGKTRLALRFAGRHQRSCRGGAWFVDLTNATSLVDVCEAIAAALEVPLPSSGASNPVGEIGRVIAARGPVLVVLDNFEHLTAFAAQSIEPWRDAAREAVFVVTSRERLGLPGEVCIALDPLGVPSDAEEDPGRISNHDAVRLFVARARAANPAFSVRDGEAIIIRDIVRRLEGIPLAIEICAARTSLLGLEQLLARLPYMWDAPVDPARRANPRGGTLRAAIGWSWKLLEPAEQSALARCAVFRGGFGVDAAEAVLGENALELVERLVHKSLVRVQEAPGFPGERRYGLFEAVAQFAGEQLGTSEQRADTEARHAAYFARAGADWAGATDGAHAGAALRRLAVEQDNLQRVYDRAAAQPEPSAEAAEHALAALIALEPLVTARGAMGRYLWQLERALAFGEGAALDAAALARGFVARGRVRQMQGEFAESIADLARAFELASERDAELAATAAVHLGLAHSFAARPNDAEAWFERARGVIATSKMPLVRALLATHYGRHLARQGRADAARTHYDEALALLRATHNARQETRLLIYIANQCLDRGALPEALAHSERALVLARDLEDKRLQAIALHGIGLVEHEAGRFADARAKLSDALRIHRASGLYVWEARVHAALGHLALERGRTKRACEHYDAWAATLGTTASGPSQAFVVACQGVAEARRGLLHDGAAKLERAQALVASGGSAADRAAVALLAELLRLLQELRAARPNERSADETRSRIARRLEAEGATNAGSATYAARFARRLLERALHDAAPDAERPEPSGPWLIRSDGRAFRPPGGETIEVPGRGTLPRLLRALAHQRAQKPGRALSTSELLSSGWPGVSITPASGANRVRVAVSALRRMGLRDLVRSDDAGYLLDPRTPVEVVEEIR